MTKEGDARPASTLLTRSAAPLAAAIVLALAVGTGTVVAQPQKTPVPPALQAAAQAALLSAERSGESFTLTYFNRPIVVLRARVLGRPPSQRAAIAVQVLDDLVAANATDPVESRQLEGVSLIFVGSRLVTGLGTPDIDELAGETLEGVTALTVSRLQQAFAEATEAHTPAELFRASIFAAIGLIIGGLVLWVIGRARRGVAAKLVAVSESTMTKTGLADLDSLRSSRLLDFQRGLVTAITVGLQLVVLYGIVSFVLEQFPYTRPWGESLSGFLVTTLENLALGAMQAVPGLFTVLVILVVARLASKLVGMWFNSIERGRIKSRWIYPETAQPTRRILTTLVWVFAVIVAYPYMPGSDTDAFKGVSVFLGLMLTLGSSGLINQIVSGFTVTYSRAVRLGDFVRIGDVEGTVIHLGVLSTKVKTLQLEEVTIPNAVVAAQTATDYSRFADTEGVFTSTSVTIGYDAPWRQVQSLLLLAAERTTGLRREPRPRVYQTALEDFYVRYTLWVSLERQESRLVTLNTLHANIQDLFNEYGVQIMSPNYFADPAAPKVVAKNDWYASPARVDGSAGAAG
ncbi:MAG TPA: mechanosensitive ion channel domain-containing protein [Vicinamibacterales bacterium]|nr:mechanosensitive ion channel domain-containing protein [Vicinamibacterales bacterium]